MTFRSASAKLAAIITLFSLVVRAQDSTSSLFTFDQDIRVFTAQAFQNIAGYDHEWRKAGMHLLRIQVRGRLLSSLDSPYIAKARRFLNSRKSDWTSCASYALLTNGPPEFKLSYDPTNSPYADRITQDLSGFSTILAEFYVTAKIPSLWAEFGAQFQKLNDQFRPHAQQALDDITQYCRLPQDYFSRNKSRMHVIFAPLLSYFQAFNQNVSGETFLIFGPQVSPPSPSSFYHEVLHDVLAPLTAKLDSNVTGRLHELYELAKSGGHIGYGHIDEAFVRTLDCVLNGRRLGWSDSTIGANVTNEYKLGFILCLAIYEQLKSYEASDLTFGEYFPHFIANIDVQREKERWQRLTRDTK